MIYDYMNQNIIVRNKINMNGGFEINRNVVFEYSDNELLMIINCKYYWFNYLDNKLDQILFET